MRMVSIANAFAGMEIAKPIYSIEGRVLVAEGVVLTEKIINQLKNRNISIVYIKDEATNDIEIKEDIPLELRIEASNVIKETFDSLKKAEGGIDKIKHLYLNVEALQVVFKNLISEVKSIDSAMNLLTTMYSHDDYTFTHSTNVTIYVLAMAVKLGFSDKKLNEIGIGSMLHDIGKIYTPIEILKKVGKLTTEEYNIIKKHPTDGFELLRKQPEVSLLSAHCAFQHHEKLDGSGYPRGLTSDEIHPYAKIMAICDVFDALTSQRSYRDAMLPHTAMEIIFAGAHTHFDDDLIQVFQQTVATYPEGVTVVLNSGETGIVIEYQFHAPSRPIVRITKDPLGNNVEKPYDIDLSKELTLMITQCDAVLS